MVDYAKVRFFDVETCVPCERTRMTREYRDSTLGETSLLPASGHAHALTRTLRVGDQLLSTFVELYFYTSLSTALPVITLVFGNILPGDPRYPLRLFGLTV